MKTEGRRENEYRSIEYSFNSTLFFKISIYTYDYMLVFINHNRVCKKTCILAMASCYRILKLMLITFVLRMGKLFPRILIEVNIYHDSVI